MGVPGGSVDRFVEELDTVRSALGLDRSHRIPGGQHVVIEDASHLCSGERREGFTALMKDFPSRRESQ